MVEDTLVDRKIETGERLLEAFDAAGVPVDAALWFYFPESERWRLVVSTSIAAEKGPLAAYHAFQGAMKAIEPPLDLNLDEIRVATRSDPIIKALWASGSRPRNSSAGGSAGRTSTASSSSGPISTERRPAVAPRPIDRWSVETR